MAGNQGPMLHAVVGEALRRLDRAVVSLEEAADDLAAGHGADAEPATGEGAVADVEALRRLHDEARVCIDDALVRLKAVVGD